MPWVVPLVTAATSVYSAARASSQRKKAEKGLENMDVPKYAPNQSILDYYQKALQKYETNPTDSAEYKLQKQNIEQGTTQALASAQNRRLGGAITPSVIQNQNNSLLKSAVSGEQRKAQEFNTLGHATQLKSAEDSKAFNQNVIAPFEKNYNLLAMKAAGQAQVQNAATQNAYNNLGAAVSLAGGNSNSNENGGWNSIFGSKGSRSLSRWNRGGQQWWQN